uniref:Flagellar motor switch protein FliN n=1 Tax=Desulfobacca acetoxidans TaxID=60893 RepID=A0A7C5AMI9_9BACT
MNFDWENPGDEPDGSPEAQEKSAALPPKSQAKAPKEEGLSNLSLLLDIPLEITAELGRTRMIIHDLLQLGQGSVIELNKLAGEPLEILVNHKLIARGEVVVVNEKFGIRLTDIISPLERIKQLG